MGKKMITASEAEIKELYDENYFYEHGSNPAYKKYIEIASENTIGGESPDYRSFIKDNRQRSILALTWDSFLQNQCKGYTATRSVALWYLSGLILLKTLRFTKSHLPIGMHGIRSVRQTQLFRMYGAVPCIAVLMAPIAMTWAFLNCSVFAGKKVYNHAICGERAWIHEHMRWNNSSQNYFFNDSPMSCEESFPDLGRGELAKLPEEEYFKTPESMKE